MPPSASTMFLKPLKSTSTKWSMRMPVSVSSVEIVQAMPPVLYAELIMLAGGGISCLVVSFLHLGICTIESRGKLISRAWSRLGEMCIRMIVSVRLPPASAVLASFWPYLRVALARAGVGADQQHVERAGVSGPGVMMSWP